ncbi:MAG: endopeptidase La [Candidatus Delongbacteria bacterium]|nr:endopeptidase La [Candidatus Delongbacteria bacterium]
MVPLRDVIIFPYMVFPLLIGRQASMEAIEHAMVKEKLLFVVAQRDPDNEEPKRRDLYNVGTVVKILQILKLPNNVIKVLIEGVARARLVRMKRQKGYLSAHVEVFQAQDQNAPEIEASARHCSGLFEEYVNLNPNIPDEITITIDQIEKYSMLADFMAAHVAQSVDKKQKILQQRTLKDQFLEIARVLKEENEILEIEKNIESQVRERISKSQRNFYLQEQMRIIRKELGEEVEDEVGDVQDYLDKIEAAKLPRHASERAHEELDKLKQIPMMSPESTVIRNYLDWMLAIPWQKRTRDNGNLKRAQQILDEDHYGLTKAKERILEHLAVLKLVKKLRGQIICFVGPPGVGKTSLGKSIARALGRKFVRLSLGGVRDEAEIRGHRRTYIGSLPGRIIQGMKKAGTVNPVFLMDEIDKLAMDFRGDPASALLEVLDPEQNATFNDHYLDVDYDISEVMFITTANVEGMIPPALRDRMEIIYLPGYLPHEKLQIARNFLVPRQVKENGLNDKQVKFSDSGINALINSWTMEAGVRELERSIATISRKIALKRVRDNKTAPLRIETRSIPTYLGPPKYEQRRVDRDDMLGASLGLAWTPVGGDILKIEVNIMPGKEALKLTGHLGDVMKESAHAAYSYLRANTAALDLPSDFYKNREIHIHVPEGAIPKDGPSAGIALATAMYSAISGKKVHHDLGMTGEITIHGDVLAIGGLTAKTMAAQRAGIKRVLIPAKNEKDLVDIPPQILKKLEFKMVNRIEEVLKYAIIGFGRKKTRSRSTALSSKSAKVS